jgi:hypothetical protein
MISINQLQNTSRTSGWWEWGEAQEETDWTTSGYACHNKPGTIANHERVTRVC